MSFIATPFSVLALKLDATPPNPLADEVVRSEKRFCGFWGMAELGGVLYPAY
jgi:hypothetical protein